MVKRNAKGAFGNLSVFPGGIQEYSDSQLLPTDPIHQDINSLKVTAIRETFEECGLLILPKTTAISKLSTFSKWRHIVLNIFEYIDLFKL
jgi:8-oxo-dGTP pyrophosphatase MutT (NUDIX family)